MYSSVNKNIGWLWLLASVFFLFSCTEQKRTTVKNYPINKPFVFSNKIIVSGNLTKDEKKQLTLDLNNYWDDSLKVQKLQKFVFFYTIKNPPVFDTSRLSRSLKYMDSYLKSIGLYYCNLKALPPIIDTTKGQIRTSITVKINLGKQILIGKVQYDLTDTTKSEKDSVLQALADLHDQESLLIPGNKYTKQSISNELDRVVGIYRQNGFNNFTRDNIYALVDTNQILITQRKKDSSHPTTIIYDTTKYIHPNWDITIKHRTITDSNVIHQFYVGNMYYYPEADDIYDSSFSQSKSRKINGSKQPTLIMRYKKGLFKMRPLREHTFMKSDSLFNEDLYFKTINSLNQIGAWKQVEVKETIRNKDTLDFNFYLIPEQKQNYTLNLEGSRNTGDINSSNLIGISTNISYRNRNVAKQAIQSVTSLRTGVEFDLVDTARSLQTFQASLGHSYSFPRLIIPNWNWVQRLAKPLDNRQTLLSMNGSYTDRFKLYQLRSLVSNWGYQGSKGNTVYLYRPLNIELYSLNKLAGLDSLIKNNPFLKLSFNTGNVISQTFSLVKNYNSRRNKNRSHYFHLGVEEAGLFTSFINSVHNNIYRYIKVETDYHQLNKFRKSQLAYRLFAGAGYNYNSSNSDIGKVLPFFKQFYAGGSNSMRAWGVRQLGLGASKNYDTSHSSFRDRFGDIQLETNLEYRFTLFNFGSFNIASTFFTDAGNIWNMRKDPTDPDANLSLNNISRSIAVGVGTGIRFDFSYFLLRLDAAYRVKDPARETTDGWMNWNNIRFTERRSNGVEVRNYAIQLGIGLPF